MRPDAGRSARRRLAPLALAACVVAFAACGGDDGGPDPLPTGSPAPKATASGDGLGASGEQVLPAVNARDVATGATVAMQNLLPSDKPLLAWFWAPH